MKLAVTCAFAFAIHAAAVAGVAAFGHARGTSEKAAVFGRTIEIDPELAAPVAHEDEPAPVARATVEKHASHGAPRAPAVVTRASAAPAVATSDVVAPDPTPTAEPVRFKMTMSSGQGGTPGARMAEATAGSASEDVVVETDVSERAKQVGGTAPRYPAEARAQGVELGAPLPFEIVVDATGRVVSTRALQHAGYGFDEAAVAALRTYRFAPAKRNGRAVAVRMKWTVDFHFD